MTGPEHYKEAERLADSYKLALADAEQIPMDTTEGWRRRMLAEDHARALLAKASVHANLAVAAATAMTVPGVSADFKAGMDWARVIDRPRISNNPAEVLA